MLERTTRQATFELLQKNPEWKVLDMASSNAGWECADVYTDVRDFTDYYQNKYSGTKKFVQCNVENPPFDDSTFDFVIASHILEHVIDPIGFCKHLQRIGKRGYIEVPTPLFDNLVDGPGSNGDPYGHKHWVTFDDSSKKIIFNDKINIVNKSVSLQEHNILMMFFKNSIVTELYWDSSIEIEKGTGIYEYHNTRGDINYVLDTKHQRMRPWRLGMENK